jgi:acyl-homoserine lactone acylase PvdQ
VTAHRALGVSAVALVLLIATLFLTIGLLFYRPLPTIDGHYRLLGLHERGEVIRDVFGIPRIYARDLHDLFFLQGYVTAQDRFAQMETMRTSWRAVLDEGSLLALDREPAVRDALGAYAKGVNKFIAQHREARALPGEIVMSGRRLEPWQPADSLVIVSAYLERVPPTSVCVSPSGPLNGAAILAADLHLAPSRAPGVGWYEIGLTGGDIRALGLSIPGVPGIVAGHNAWVAWAPLSSLRLHADPVGTTSVLLLANGTRDADRLGEAMRGVIAGCVAGIDGRRVRSDRAGSVAVAADRALVVGGEGGRGAALSETLARAPAADLEAVRVQLGRPTAPFGARLLIDLADVDTSRSAVSHGASGHRASPHFNDQTPLWEIGQTHRLPFTRGAIGRTDGELVFRAR